VSNFTNLKIKKKMFQLDLLPQTVPQILINRESLKHMNFDIELLGDCDVIVNELLLRLEQRQQLAAEENSVKSWSQICTNTQLLTQISDDEAENVLFANEQANSSSSSLETSTVIIGNQSKPVSVDDKDLKRSDTPTPVADQEPKSSEIQTSAEEDRVISSEKSNSALAKKYTTDYLREGSFLYLKPNMYIFHGAEIQLKHVRKKLRRLNQDQEAGEVSESDEDSDDEDEDDEDDDDDSEISDESDEIEEDENNGELPGGENVSGIKECSDEKESGKEDEDSEPESSPNKNNLMGFFNEYDEEDDEDDDEDFSPEVNLKNKKQTDSSIGDTFKKSKPDVV